MELVWILTREDRVTFNKAAAVDLAISDVEPEEERVALAMRSAT